MKNEVEQIALQNDMSIEFVTWFFNEKKAGCGNVWFMMMAAMWEGWKGRSIEMDKLAAENVGIKEAIPQLKNIDYQNENMDDVALAEEIGFNAAVMAMHRWVPKTPATDRIVAGNKADGVEEFVSNTTHKIFDESDAVSALSYLSLANAYVKQLREGADK